MGQNGDLLAVVNFLISVCQGRKFCQDFRGWQICLTILGISRIKSQSIFFQFLVSEKKKASIKGKGIR